MTGHAVGGALAHELVQAGRAQAAHGLGERADAGDDDALGRAQLVVVGGEHGPGADLGERLLDRPAVAHAVVDDADHRTPFVTARRSPVGSIADRGAQRPRERLERRLDHVVGVRAALDGQVQRQPRARGHRAEELLGQLVVERPGRAGRAGRPRRRAAAVRRCRSRSWRAPRHGTTAWP
jgi:hypothetical protein